VIRTLRSADIASGIFLAVIGAVTLGGSVLITSAAGARLHPRTLPIIIGIALVSGGTWMIFRAVSIKYEDKPVEWPDRQGSIRWAVALLMLAVYAYLMQILGFMLTSALFVTAFIWYFGRYKPWFAIAWGAATIAFIYALFIWLLKMELPTGFLPF
jgi:putative tricarboxylic transport membrane protein